MKNKELVRTIKFTLFSISAGIIEIGLFSLLDFITGWSYCIKYLLSLVASVLWNFTLNREYTFRSASNVVVAMIKVLLFYVFFTIGSIILGNYLADVLKWNEIIVTLINMLLNFILEYLYDRFFVFRNSLDTKNIHK